MINSPKSCANPQTHNCRRRVANMSCRMSAAAIVISQSDVCHTHFYLRRCPLAPSPFAIIIVNGDAACLYGYMNEYAWCVLCMCHHYSSLVAFSILFFCCLPLSSPFRWFLCANVSTVEMGNHIKMHTHTLTARWTRQRHGEQQRYKSDKR